MRTPPNEKLASKARSSRAKSRDVGAEKRVSTSLDTNGVGDGARPAHERRCILSGERADPATLIRLALGPDGEVAPDVRARAGGRGAWIGVDRKTLETAQTKGKLRGALARAFKSGDVSIPDDLGARIEAALERNALDRLGLEARGGTLVTGSERIDAAAREGRVHLLLHAADAGEDGNRKLDQALRVGSDAEGSGIRGLVLPADRTTLSLALGRENVVHVAVTDRGAAERVRVALDRWRRFIDRDFGGQPCETASQGSSGLAPSATAGETTRI